MNNVWAETKTLIVSIIGTLLVLFGIVLLILTGWYVGMILIVPIGALNVFQLVQCIRWRIRHRE